MPKLVTGDGALGAWAALRDVFPDAGAKLLGARVSRAWAPIAWEVMAA
jgi:hypothetical protein